MLSLLTILASVFGDVPDRHDLEHFEAHIRPILVERCYRCHNSVDRTEGGLALDHARGLLQGGYSGPALVPGDPAGSLLVRAVRHADDAPRMPRNEPRLEPHQVAAFEAWIQSGAPDPRSSAPTAQELDLQMSWSTVRERRAAWWSFQPLQTVATPAVADEHWPLDDVDRFVLAELERRGAQPAPDMARSDFLRRASFVARGLPPTPGELQAFQEDSAPGAHERAVDRLLSSPHYAERIARHWMDLFRYAETHGSEGDPTIPQAYRYRDYLVRAFDQDLSWRRLVQEHVAGDRLSPRIDPETGINDAALGVGHLRFVQHGYAPTDPLEEQVRFIDNQIDVLSKAILGLTVSCARCHDHKFDPISQADYHALYGILGSVRPALRTVDSRQRATTMVAELREYKPRLRQALADAWQEALANLPQALDAGGPAHEEARKEGESSPLFPWVAAQMSENVQLSFGERIAAFEESLARVRAQGSAKGVRWHLGGGEAAAWFAHGSLLDSTPSQPGEFSILPEGERVIDSVLPGGIYSHLLSNRHSGSLTSPWIDIEDGDLWVRALGGGGARARYSMQGYPRVAGPVYKAHNLNSSRARWMSWNMLYWADDRAYLELATARDLPVEARGEERSFWGLTDARFVPRGEAAPRDESCEFLVPLLGASRRAHDAPSSMPQLAQTYVHALDGVIERWREGRASDPDTRFLDFFVRHQLLPVTLGELSRVAPLVQEYRRLEAQVPVPTRAPGVTQGPRLQQPLMPRGDHRKPGQAVPQRFFEWLDPTPYAGDGREALAADLVRADNPLTPRVAVNRIWSWVFGEGLVATPDNFGLLSREPVHAALLDHLALRFIEGGWSTRDTLRTLLLTRTFRSQRAPRRLNAESVRDALLSVSGRLDPRRFGPSTDERGTRRSLYVAQRRGAPPAFMAAFDQPAPNTTCGLRPVTNVPAQALALLNAPVVVDCARSFAQAILSTPSLEDDSQRVQAMYVQALGRGAEAHELARVSEFLARAREQLATARAQVTRLDETIRTSQLRSAEWIEEGRSRARERRVGQGEPERGALADPISSWEFEGDLRDELGELHGVAHQGARIADGQLLLDGKGFVLTAPLARELRQKTLEVWVRLDDLQQRAGGAMTVQSTDGGVFDSIVYAEQEPLRWMAGSNTFNRTQSVGGPAEEATELLHLAITYQEDGTITVYRDGVPYGTPYNKGGGPVTYAAGESQVLFGARHGTTASMQTRLVGALERARLYDRALTPDEVAASASGDPDFVSRRDARAALSAGELAQLADLERQSTRAHEQREELLPIVKGGGSRPWQELAHALFQLEEFRYLR